MTSGFDDLETLNLIQSGEHEQALLRCTESLEETRLRYGEMSSEFAQMAFIVSLIYHRLGMSNTERFACDDLFSESFKYAESALSVRDKIHGVNSSASGVLVEFLARLSKLRNDANALRKYAKRSVEISLAVTGVGSTKHSEATALYESLGV